MVKLQKKQNAQTEGCVLLFIPSVSLLRVAGIISPHVYQVCLLEIVLAAT